MADKKTPDYYSVLGLSRNATIEDINQAYRTLAKKYHPDVPKGDEENFKLLAQSYHVLRDPKERKKYDANLPGSNKDYRGSAAQIYFDEQFSAYFFAVGTVYAGIIIILFFLLDNSHFIGISSAITIYGIIFYLIFKKIIKDEK